MAEDVMMPQGDELSSWEFYAATITGRVRESESEREKGGIVWIGSQRHW